MMRPHCLCPACMARAVEGSLLLLEAGRAAAARRSLTALVGTLEAAPAGGRTPCRVRPPAAAPAPSPAARNGVGVRATEPERPTGPCRSNADRLRAIALRDAETRKRARQALRLSPERFSRFLEGKGNIAPGTAKRVLQTLLEDHT